RQVFALAEVAGRAVADRADQRLVARDDARECIAAAGQALRDERRVVAAVINEACGHWHHDAAVARSARKVTEMRATKKPAGSLRASGRARRPLRAACRMGEPRRTALLAIS